jgi:hypothetical protein
LVKLADIKCSAGDGEERLGDDHSLIERYSPSDSACRSLRSRTTNSLVIFSVTRNSSKPVAST